MPSIRLLSIGFAFALCGCGSIGAIGLPPLGKSQPTPPVETGGLPPTTGEPPGDAVVAEPLPGADQAQDGLPAPVTTATAPSPGGLGRTDLLGGWTITSSGDSCQLFMTLTSWTGGYRASTRGCNNALLKSISAWNLDGKQVTLAGAGGEPVARLSQSGNGRFDGQAEGGGGTVTFYR